MSNLGVECQVFLKFRECHGSGCHGTHGTYTNAPSVTLVASRPQFAHGDDHSWPEAHAQWFRLHMEGVTNN